MDVVYACNNYYINQTIVSMISLVRYNSAVQLHLVSDHISSDNINLLKSILNNYGHSLSIINADELFKDISFSHRDRHPRTIYAKLFLDEVMDTDKVIYLDSDILVEGSLEGLFDREMEKELVAGVMMPYSMQIKSKLGLQRGDPYVCDGIVLLNLKGWRKQKISDRCREYVMECSGEPYMLSEGVLNYVCKGFMGILSPKYNLMPSMIFYTYKQMIRLFETDLYYTPEELRKAIERPVIIHFMNELYNRPWYEPCDHPYRDQYRIVDRLLFGKKNYEKKNISKHTRFNRWLYDKLPFELYRILYRFKHNLRKVWRRE